MKTGDTVAVKIISLEEGIICFYYLFNLNIHIQLKCLFFKIHIFM